MKYNELNLDKTPSRKRVGRGISAGQGKTAGRGTKGQGSRTGSKLNATFQGGQLSLVKSTPKAKGFKSIKSPAQVIYLDTLNGFTGTVADNNSLFEAHYVATPFHSIKVIARGELTRKITLRVQGASKSVQAAITAQGGTFEKVTVPLKPSRKKAENTAK
jgi:large subunit ribosomal protein L15